MGAVIVATGHQEFDARRKLALGFGRYRNVVTQSQLARLLAAAGPTEGEVYRPSDGAVPQKIFMLQCVGSRDCQSQRQRALLGDLLPVCHAARLAAQAALSGRGHHGGLHRHAHSGQEPRGVLPARAKPRRALRAGPRR